ncbi:MAG TPA: arylesterase [Acidobacteriaceae bacterium]|jgi:acyl-CoA thioesterase-1|nr:arylesterase [Acidobacteriaceae bacterium]
MTGPVPFLLAAFLLSNGYAVAPRPVPSHPAPVQSRTLPVIDCFGDSITAGRGVAAGHTYPDDLQADLNARGYRYHVVNSGISGNTTKDGVDRLKDVLRLHPAVVIVEFGGNDGLRGIPIADTRRNLDTILATLLHSGSKVLLAGITLPPNYGADYIQQFDETYRLLAAKYHVPLLPELYAGIYTVPGAIQDDAVHPTAKGDTLLAQEFLPLLLPLLHK